jgi:hypothetical protein
VTDKGVGNALVLWELLSFSPWLKTKSFPSPSIPN